MTADNLIKLELFASKQKYNYLPTFKKKHSKLLSKIQMMLDDNINIRKIKKFIKDELFKLYEPINKANHDIAVEQFNIITDNTDVIKPLTALVMGSNINELITARMSIHFRDLVAQSVNTNININKTKSRANNSITAITKQYTKAVREQAYNVIEK